MKASALEFRFRYLLHGVIFILGLFSPWNRLLHLDPAGPSSHVWGLLSANLAKAGLGSIAEMFKVTLIFGIAFAGLGAGLRIWGDAYLGARVVKDGAMHVGLRTMVIADGPFAHLRNPLYLGTFLHTLALSLLMSRSGAIFTILAIAILQLRLVLAEEGFLSEKLGTRYTDYARRVPRFLPAVRSRVARTGLQPLWAQAFVGEVYFFGVALSFAILGWQYDAILLTQSVIVCFGLGLISLSVIPRVSTSMPQEP